MDKKYTREELIAICERSIVDVAKWNDRDTPVSQRSVGLLWALLKANCQFEVTYSNGKFDNRTCVTNKDTIWVDAWFPNFSNMEDGFDLDNRDTMYKETFYLPTVARLEEAKGEDWY